MRFKKLINNF